MLRLFTFSILLLGVYACSHGGGSAYTETGAICDTAGLESQLVSIRDQSRSTRGALGVGLPEGGGAIGGERQVADVERVYRLRDRLDIFDAEVDVHYRNMTQSCKAYSRCMEMRRYREGECRSSLARWEGAEQTFASLTRELAEIQAEVDIIRTVSRGKRHKGHRVNPCDKGGRNCSAGRYQY